MKKFADSKNDIIFDLSKSNNMNTYTLTFTENNESSEVTVSGSSIEEMLKEMKQCGWEIEKITQIKVS